jgi:hypothetical protein
MLLINILSYDTLVSREKATKSIRIAKIVEKRAADKRETGRGLRCPRPVRQGRPGTPLIPAIASFQLRARPAPRPFRVVTVALLISTLVRAWEEEEEEEEEEERC